MIVLSALKDFDKYESVLHHERLEISIPAGFYRHAGVALRPDRLWEPVDVRLFYYHRELNFSVALSERSAVPGFTIVERQRRTEECVIEYGVAEEISLSLADAKRLISFLQKYFLCFHFNLSTKLSM